MQAHSTTAATTCNPPMVLNLGLIIVWLRFFNFLTTVLPKAFSQRTFICQTHHHLKNHLPDHSLLLQPQNSLQVFIIATAVFTELWPSWDVCGQTSFYLTFHFQLLCMTKLWTIFVFRDTGISSPEFWWISVAFVVFNRSPISALLGFQLSV